VGITFPENFYKRLGFFLIGLTIGIFALNYFMSKKNTSFDYLPNARTLKSIRNKPYLVYSDKVKDLMQKNAIDSTAINSLLYYGDVVFNKSNRGKAPCHTYLIEPTKRSAPISITVKRCDSIATILDLVLKE
jgi:hypothetical protein